MKWKSIILTLLTLIVVQPLSAWTYNPAVGRYVGNNSCNQGNCQTGCNPCQTNFNCCLPCVDFTLYGDWLYWKVRRCELDYVFPCSGVLVAEGKSHSTNPCYDSGFRVGARAQICNWDFGARYTYYHTDDEARIIDPDGNIQPSRLHPAGNAQIGKNELKFADSTYDFDYDVVDIEFGRTIDTCYCDHLRFFGGVKLAYIDQKLFSCYSADPEYKKGQPTTAESAAIWEKTNVDAYGLYAGGEGHWNLCGCFGAFGRIGGGALYGDFNRSVLEKRTDDDTVIVNTKDCCAKLITNFEIGAGLEFVFNTCFCGDWGIQVGYEFHHWGNMLDFIQFSGNDDTAEYPATTDRHSEDIGLDGVFVRLSASF